MLSCFFFLSPKRSWKLPWPRVTVNRNTCVKKEVIIKLRNQSGCVSAGPNPQLKFDKKRAKRVCCTIPTLFGIVTIDFLIVILQNWTKIRPPSTTVYYLVVMTMLNSCWKGRPSYYEDIIADVGWIARKPLKRDASAWCNLREDVIWLTFERNPRLRTVISIHSNVLLM